MQGIAKWLTIVGLSLTLIGAGCGTYGVWLSPKQAVERGVSRFSDGTNEQQSQPPAVQNLLQQSHFALAGFVLIGLGTLLQIGGAVTRHPDQVRYDEAVFRREQISAARWLNGITFWAAIVALGGLVVLFFTLRDNDSAMVAANRAWIAPISANLSNPIQNFVVIYKNTGREPALNLTGQQEPASTVPLPQGKEIWRDVFAKYPLDNSLCDRTVPDTDIAVYPDTTNEYQIPITSNPTFTDGTINAQHALRLHGCFAYRSPITKKLVHKSEYCFLFIENSTHGYDAKSCVYGNRAIEGRR